MSSWSQNLVKNFLSRPFLVRLRETLIQLGLFDPTKTINLIGMASILLTKERLPLAIPLLLKGLLFGVDYVKTQHLRPGYYQQWLGRREHYNVSRIKKEIACFARKPIISLVLTGRAGDRAGLEQTVASIRRQFYPFWELLVPGEAGKADFRIRGLSETAPAEAWRRAEGEFLVFMAAGDRLAPDAIFEVAKLLNRRPQAEFIYSDEDKIGADGVRFDPLFKPDWSPDLLHSMPYTGSLAVCRRAALERLGGLRPEFGPAALYDLVLRLTENLSPGQIFHLPRLLYHADAGPEARNQLPGAGGGQEFGRLALEDYRQRNGIAGVVEDGALPGTYRLRRKLTASPMVAIIIPFRDQVRLLQRCVTSILTKTDYPHYEIILVDNQSREPETHGYLRQLSPNPKIRLLSYDRPFNFSAINNFAVSQTEHEYLLFLNNDTEVLASEWLRALLEQGLREEVGAVGAKLLYPNDTIQHAGITMGVIRICAQSYRYFPAAEPGYFGQLQVVRNCAAVTGACLLTKRSLFEAVGGFDEANLPVAFNDVDLCLKILERGRLVVWTPYALLYHHEYASRGDDREERQKYVRFNAEMDYMERRWGAIMDHDPYYNPNLTRLFENYGF